MYDSFGTPRWTAHELNRELHFARDDEAEACAKIADDLAELAKQTGAPDWQIAAAQVAYAIRARIASRAKDMPDVRTDDQEAV